MKKLKTLFTSSLVIFLLVIAFCGAYCKGYYSYADTPQYMSDAELEAAYQAYLQSKGGGLIGNAGARITYMNGKLLNYMSSTSNATGITTIDQLKSEMSWERSQIESGRSILSLAISPRGASFLNLYTQWLLQNHYFGNNATENNDGMFNDGIDDTLYSGEYFVDGDGNSCLVYVANATNVTSGYIEKTNILAYGTTYRYTGEQAFTLSNNGTSSYSFNIHYKNNTYVGYLNGAYNDRVSFNNTNGGGITLYRSDYYNGSVIVIKSANNNYYVGGFYESPSTGLWRAQRIISLNDVETTETDINFYTNTNNNILVFPTINNDGTLYITPKVKVGLEYEPYTINEGDNITNIVNNYYNDSGTKDNTITIPSDTPSGGGGSGGGGSGGNDNPSGGTPPNWSNPYPNLTPDGNGGFNFNFTLPDLNIDWNISGLKEKFPFSIPFDLISFVRVLDAEPETPQFTGTINLIIYQWQIDADLSAFDNLASIVRNVEFIGFCITLILITRKMIKG